jgi:hypothetical protein
VAIADLTTDQGRGVFVRKQPANVYSMMLILSLLFIMVGCLFLYLEMKSFDMKVKVPQTATVSSVPESAPPTNVPPPGGPPGM